MFYHIGNQVFYRSEKTPFSEFLFSYLRTKLGDVWFAKQEKEPAQRQHVVMKWFIQARALRTQAHAQGKSVSQMTGGAKCLLQLAYDLLVLQYANSLPDMMLAKLRERDQFQSVRYEIAVASMFVVGGFRIDYCPPSGDRICEFIATYNDGICLAVEAKCRHRRDVLHEKRSNASIFETDIGPLYKAARAKRPLMPFVIMIDLNLPPDDVELTIESPAMRGVIADMGVYGEHTKANPDDCNLVVFTNYSFYYNESSLPVIQQPIYAISKFPKYPLPNKQLWTSLQFAINTYADISEQ